ncbi:type IV toxin-antitoxin system AbiEi family antitoxin domain-containing protein [Arthrobacter sp. UM1]|uniref:type IV toxin-antitoxin system AbiEi family antitoxin domain-containing protein n=1 Tax=Arthrobacter sp. UM1 TaxID=2766776 RepID=UPI001CF70DDE|nr:type IV toxin-antitoxin system AbiEi family antitoxin domain-containing protein [Arthrobacter sp. UM1]MCB4208729.1 type IV toxin-antitoxin system AbiEi family antitoxin domain-containing protein [Arthrobacter sp. UM1]
MSYRDFLSLCSRQGGIVTTAQARRIGLSTDQILSLSRRGDLRRLRRGVYVHEAAPFDYLEDVKAAWLSLYPHMTMSERLAGPELGVLRAESAAEHLEIGDLVVHKHSFFVPAGKKSRACDIETRTSPLTTDDITIVKGLPVTTPTRTIVDLLEEPYEPEHVGAAVWDARDRGLELDVETIRRALTRYASGYLSAEAAEYFILTRRPPGIA